MQCTQRTRMLILINFHVPSCLTRYLVMDGGTPNATRGNGLPTSLESVLSQHELAKLVDLVHDWQGSNGPSGSPTHHYRDPAPTPYTPTAGFLNPNSIYANAGAPRGSDLSGVAYMQAATPQPKAPGPRCVLLFFADPPFCTWCASLDLQVYHFARSEPSAPVPFCGSCGLTSR